ncbi:MAG: hypothetical protein IT379_00035 [Deltaproteobacteria bacterium]|nr:hypothetical protein [Deltaproteobacteria bacterium]
MRRVHTRARVVAVMLVALAGCGSAQGPGPTTGGPDGTPPAVDTRSPFLLVPADAVLVARIDVPAWRPIIGEPREIDVAAFMEEGEEPSFWLSLFAAVWRPGMQVSEVVVAGWDPQGETNVVLGLVRGRLDRARVDQALAGSRARMERENLSAAWLAGDLLAVGDTQKVEAARALHAAGQGSGHPHLDALLAPVAAWRTAALAFALSATPAVREQLATTFERRQRGAGQLAQHIRGAAGAVQLNGSGLDAAGYIEARNNMSASLLALAAGVGLPRLAQEEPLLAMLRLDDVVRAVRIRPQGTRVNMSLHVDQPRLREIADILRTVGETGELPDGTAARDAMDDLNVPRSPTPGPARSSPRSPISRGPEARSVAASP